MFSKILILDDDRKILEAVKEALQHEGFDAYIFEETDDILSLIGQYKPDLVLIDYLLKGVNGADLCAKIKNNPATGQLPVILFSEYTKLQQSASYRYFDAFLAKPFDLSVLLGLIGELTEQQSKIRINTNTIGY